MDVHKLLLIMQYCIMYNVVCDILLCLMLDKVLDQL